MQASLFINSQQQQHVPVFLLKKCSKLYKTELQVGRIALQRLASTRDLSTDFDLEDVLKILGLIRTNRLACLFRVFVAV